MAATTKTQAVALEVAARCRHDGGPIDVVRCGADVIYSGAPLDALRMAKDLVFNPGFDAVTLTLASGTVLDANAIRAARF